MPLACCGVLNRTGEVGEASHVGPRRAYADAKFGVDQWLIVENSM
jgi:hypothetical protein